MNALFKITALLVLAHVTALAQTTLSVEIDNLRSVNGQIALELLDENEETVTLRREPVSGEKTTITFDDLADGQYAIRYFHDENMNDTLDKNWVGIPKEGYGFSNDAYGTFGPKGFDKWLFSVKGKTEIRLKTGYQ